jgi:MFS family permease
MAAGPVLGGWLVDTLSWRAIFFINVPLALAAILLAIKSVPESRDEQAGRIDWPGAMLAASGLGAVVWALTAMPARGAADPAVIAALAGGAALLAAFVAVEARRPNAMMPLRLFRSRAFAGANLLTFLLYFALGGTLFFLPFALIRLGGYSATGAGAALLPFALVMGLGSAFAGKMADQLGARPLLIGGPWIAAMGFAVLGFAESRPYWAGVLPGMIVLALGMTVTVAPLTATVMSAVDQRHAGLASGINNAVARIAGLFAVAALGALLFWRFAAALPADDPSAAREALNAVMAGGAARVDGAERAFAAAFRAVMLTCAGCAVAAGAVAAVTIPGKLHAQQQGDYDG